MHDVVIVEAEPYYERDQDGAKGASIARRLLAAVRRGNEYCGSIGWTTWTSARWALGGRVGTSTFRAAVDVLLESGELLELWLEPRGDEPPIHALCLARDMLTPLPRPPVRAQGRRDIISQVLGPAWLRGGYQLARQAIAK